MQVTYAITENLALQTFVGQFVLDGDFRKRVQQNPQQVLNTKTNLSAAEIEQLISQLMLGADTPLPNLADPGWF